MAVTPAAAAAPAMTLPAFFFFDVFLALGFGIDFFALWYFAMPLAAFHVDQPSIAFRLVSIFIGLLSSGPGRSSLAGGDVNRAPKRDEPGFLDRLRQRWMRCHTVGHGLDGRLCVERDHSGLDQVRHMRADHGQPEELAVAILVNRLDPADRLVLHDGTGVRHPGEPADGDDVSV